MFGKVFNFKGKPLAMIKVAVYDDMTQIERAYTNDDGGYTVETPHDKPITVLFDTHHTLVNAEAWQPSVVANIVANGDLRLDRFLLETGYHENEPAAVDVLAAYQYAAMWNERNPEPGYARNAAARLSRLKLASAVLTENQRQLLRYFEEEARRP